MTTSQFQRRVRVVWNKARASYDWHSAKIGTPNEARHVGPDAGVGNAETKDAAALAVSGARDFPQSFQAAVADAPGADGSPANTTLPRPLCLA